MASLPAIHFLRGHDRRQSRGHPWVFSNEIRMDAAAKALPPGQQVRLFDSHGNFAGSAFFNPHSLIAARVVAPLSASVSASASERGEVPVDVDWFSGLLAQAQGVRERFFSAPFYRLVHAEADGLPGLVIDRFGGVFVVQLNTAAMDSRSALIAAALKSLFSPEGMIFRRDSGARAQEGLAIVEEPEILGHIPSPLPVEENGVTFYCDPAGGQKTGWFFDHRQNRAAVAAQAQGRSLLDLYSYAGGFALAAAKAGARHVLAVDRSKESLALAAKAAADNGVAQRVEFLTADVFDVLAGFVSTGRTFDLVVADPPAFIKSRKTLMQGLKGYRKLARLSAGAVAPGGLLFFASCSHHAPLPLLTEAVAAGLHDAGRAGRIVAFGTAGPDHPVHPLLPETAYLKSLTLLLD